MAFFYPILCRFSRFQVVLLESTVYVWIHTPPGEKEHHRLKSALIGDILVPRRVSLVYKNQPFCCSIHSCSPRPSWEVLSCARRSVLPWLPAHHSSPPSALQWPLCGVVWVPSQVLRRGSSFPAGLNGWCLGCPKALTSQKQKTKNACQAKVGTPIPQRKTNPENGWFLYASRESSSQKCCPNCWPKFKRETSEKNKLLLKKICEFEKTSLNEQLQQNPYDIPWSPDWFMTGSL